MEKLNEIIEAMALAQFQSDTCGLEKRNEFLLRHAKLKEFIDYFTSKKTGHGVAWYVKYVDTILKNMQGLTESFCNEVLWVRLKDKYIEDAVKGLENKIEQSYKITIESITK